MLLVMQHGARPQENTLTHPPMVEELRDRGAIQHVPFSPRNQNRAARNAISKEIP